MLSCRFAHTEFLTDARTMHSAKESKSIVDIGSIKSVDSLALGPLSIGLTDFFLICASSNCPGIGALIVAAA